MPDLSKFSGMKAIGILGFIFEQSRKERNLTTLSKGLEFAKTMDISNFSNEEKTLYHYNLSNGWSYKLKITSNPDEINFKDDAIVQEILNLRLALSYCDFPNSGFMKSQLYVNLGNIFSHLGRTSEAIPLWRMALDYTPNFGMAIGNIGFGVFHYGKILPSDYYMIIFMQYAYKKLKQVAASDDVYSEAKTDFCSLTASIVDVIGIKNLNHKFNLNNYSLGDSITEVEYREWCLQNKLFLNYLNDIYALPIAAADCLDLPGITMELNEVLIFHDIFNQIKQEYISARYFIYKGLKYDLPHFADKGNTLTDTFLDLPQYSFNIETLKSGFKLCYSIFDKIALFINRYFELGAPANMVNFNKIWYVYDKRCKPKDLKMQIKESNNWILRGLYWLSRDIYYDNVGTADPEAQYIAKIRNYAEHKVLKIGNVDTIKEINEGLTLVVNREYFEDKCMKTLTMARAAIIYLSLAVHLSERMKNPSDKTISVTLPSIEDECKY